MISWRHTAEIYSDAAAAVLLFASEPGRFTFFDWGDAAVAHPFCSFLVPAQQLRLNPPHP